MTSSDLCYGNTDVNQIYFFYYFSDIHALIRRILDFTSSFFTDCKAPRTVLYRRYISDLLLFLFCKETDLSNKK